MIFSGIPQCASNFQRSMLSKAFLKSTKVMYKGEFPSRDCSMITRRVVIWSEYGLFFRKPDCSYRNSLSTSVFILSRRIMLKCFPGIDSNVMPHPVFPIFQIAFLGELEQVAISPILWNLFFNPDLPKEPVKTVHWCLCISLYCFWWNPIWARCFPVLQLQDCFPDFLF